MKTTLKILLKPVLAGLTASKTKINLVLAQSTKIKKSSSQKWEDDFCIDKRVSEWYNKKVISRIILSQNAQRRSPEVGVRASSIQFLGTA